MPPVEALRPDQLFTACDPDLFEFETTDELTANMELVGQPRVLAAVRLGVDIDDQDYNIFAVGPSGTGKHSFIQHYLRDRAAERGASDDLCYVNNFAEPNKPTALVLPAGTGVDLRTHMERLVEEVTTSLPAAFESEEYQARLHAVEDEFKKRSARRVEEIQERARGRGIAMVQTPMGMMFTPLRDGEPLNPEAVARLDEDDQHRLQADIAALQKDLQKALAEMPSWERQRRSRVRELNREVSELAIGHLIDELRDRYAEHPAVLDYLATVREDLVDNAQGLLKAQEQQMSDPLKAAAMQAQPVGDLPFWRRYRVNVLVDRRDEEGAPVVFEDHPTYQNLLGRIEHLTHMGALTTDFTLIRSGALHRANGGYLIIEALKILQQPFAWDGLKRALKARKLKTESPGQAYTLISTMSLEPESVPMRVKVVLLGDRFLYSLLSRLDPEFFELFKVTADFDDQIDRTDDNQRHYARLIASMVHHHTLRPFDRSAVARVIEQSARRAGDAERLSAHAATLADLLREANYWAGVSGNGAVTAGDVQRAIDEQVYRADRLRERIQDEMLRRTIYIDTADAKVGQVNGLSVIQVGTFSFGVPTRITARVRLGKGEVIDIEREVELGGPLHTKGVLILTSFLGARYATQHPLSLSASLVFEQSYRGVEGDSASSAELYALLSAIAEAPVAQTLATTGSVNQHGEIQPIGGVNEKIEGFFDLCASRGLSGDQGVLIPAANVKHLALRADVIDAVAAGAFHVYPIEHVDEGAELMMGVPMGERDDDGRYPEGSLNDRIEQRLEGFADRWHAFAARRLPDAES
jgi:lon-related putative ATP-dependent protease